MTLEEYKTALLELATAAAATTETIAPPEISMPFLFMADLFTTLATLPLTREGTERFLDTLFANSSFKSILLGDTDALQADMATALSIPTKSRSFQDYWTHIICPAWNQHADIQRVLSLSEC